MRVPRTTQLLTRRPRDQRRAATSQRRADGRSDAPAASAPATPVARELREERRVRESGGPDDRAHYSCSCGFAFDAPVSTSVACPHCGSGQAW